MQYHHNNNQSGQDKGLTIPTVLTLARIIVVPFMVTALLRRFWAEAFIYFSIAAITDILDGYLARLWREESSLGALLDPIADRIWMLSCYSALLVSPLPVGKIPFWFFAVILAKEFLIFAGAFLFGICQQVVAIRPLWWGKLAGIVQGGFLLAMLLLSAISPKPFMFFSPFLFLVLLFNLIPLVHYSVVLIRGLCRHGC